MKNINLRENNFIKIFINMITLIRLIGALLLPYICYKYGILIASINILCLFLTDAVDGFLARTFNLSTFLGSLLDVISDKLLNFISFILLTFKIKIMYIPLLLEVFILITNFLIYRKGGNVKASKIGKIKTIIFGIFVTLSYLLIALELLNLINININLSLNIICIIIIVFSISTLIDYILKYNKVKNNKVNKIIPRNKKLKNFKEVFSDLVDSNYYYIHKDEPIIKQLYK